MDDGTLISDQENVFQDLESIISRSKDIGLELNFSKCELAVTSNDTEERNKILEQFNFIAPGIKLLKQENTYILGCPLYDTGLSKALEKRTSELDNMTTRMCHLPSHMAFYLMQRAFSIPKMNHLLRCTPCWRSKLELKQYDNVLRQSISNICNVNLENDNSWIQATLPIKLGGLGLRDVNKLCYPAFLGSWNSSNQLSSLILPNSISQLNDSANEEAILNWSLITNMKPLEIPTAYDQKIWDEKIHNICHKILLDRMSTNKDQARLLALQEKESGAWLHALPSTNLGTLLDIQCFRISICLGLGIPMCVPHPCICGEIVDKLGHHGLSCYRRAGKRARHEMINDLVKRALTSAEIPSIRKPNGYYRKVNKRPDGITLIPWLCGKPLLWDVSCTDTLAKSYIELSSKKAGEAAHLRENTKKSKYVTVETYNNYHFVPIAIETLGPWGDDARKIINEIGQKIQKITNESRSTSYLSQRISIAVQRGNAASVLGTIEDSSNDKLEEIFYIL
jgi:hypothetical protein